MARKPPAASVWANRVGLAGYGLWGRMQSIMESGKPYGHLTDLDGSPMSVAELGRIVGERTPAVQLLLDRLVAAGATDFDGTTYSDPGMIWRRSVSKARSDAGKRGAEVTNLRHGAPAFAQTSTDLPQQPAGVSAEGAPSREDLSGSSQSGLTTTTATTSAHAIPAVAPEERLRRLTIVERNSRVQEIARGFDNQDDRVLLYTLLVQVSLKGGPDGARGRAWRAELADMVNPQRMHGKPVSYAILAQSIRDYAAKGWLDDEADPQPAHFRAFVEYVRSGVSGAALPTRVGSKGWKAGANVKQPAAIDTGGNDAAADRLKRQLGDQT